MVVSSNSFIGAPNNILKPASDDDIELFVSEVDVEGVDESIYYITDDEVYEPSDTSYLDDTYDEDDYYFSEADDDDYVDDEDDLDVDDSESESEDTDHGAAVVHIASDTDSSASDKSNSITNTTATATTTATQQVDPTVAENNG